MEKISYIDDDINKGIRVDWKKVHKEIKKLKIPTEIYNPLYNTNMYDNSYFVELSERSIGKTTNWLLVGLVLYKLYGIQTQYVRQIENMITPKNCKDLYKTIIKFGYISKIFDGKYNSIEYKARRWTLLYRDDDDGNVINKDANYCTISLDIEHNEVYKSSYSTTSGDLIIFDEFISKYYRPDEFIYFLDLIKTIQRERQTVKVVMLANTLDIHSQYFHELEIFDTLQQMELGDYKQVITDLGTKIYIKLLSPDKVLKTNKSISNRLYYGFKNTKLNAITGRGWNIEVAQHIPKNLEYTVLVNNLYIYHNNKMLKCDVVKNDYGICIYAHWSSKIYDDSIIFTLQNINDSRYVYKLGTSYKTKLFDKLIKANKVYFASNDCASFFRNYYKQC